MFEKSSASELASVNPRTRPPGKGFVAWPGSNGPPAWLSMPVVVCYRLTGPWALMISWKAAGASLWLHLPAALRAATIRMFSR
jgi:hypothetical protein